MPSLITWPALTPVTWHRLRPSWQFRSSAKPTGSRNIWNGMKCSKSLPVLMAGRCRASGTMPYCACSTTPGCECRNWLTWTLIICGSAVRTPSASTAKAAKNGLARSGKKPSPLSKRIYKNAVSVWMTRHRFSPTATAIGSPVLGCATSLPTASLKLQTAVRHCSPEESLPIPGVTPPRCTCSSRSFLTASGIARSWSTQEQGIACPGRSNPWTPHHRARRR